MEDESRGRCVLMCKHFHESVRKMSEKYEKEMKRCNYVTPTSYLELILTFKSLLKGKRDDILNLKTRYEMGLGKLEFASSQVKNVLFCKCLTEQKRCIILNVKLHLECSVFLFLNLICIFYVGITIND